METKHLKKEHWRKSQQWFILNRFHAELAVKDEHIKEVFKRYRHSSLFPSCSKEATDIVGLMASTSA